MQVLVSIEMKSSRHFFGQNYFKNAAKKKNKEKRTKEKFCGKYKQELFFNFLLKSVER